MTALLTALIQSSFCVLITAVAVGYQSPSLTLIRPPHQSPLLWHKANPSDSPPRMLMMSQPEDLWWKLIGRGVERHSLWGFPLVAWRIDRELWIAQWKGMEDVEMKDVRPRLHGRNCNVWGHCWQTCHTGSGKGLSVLGWPWWMN